MDINELLDKAKTRANLPSDYALAKALGLSRGWISEYRKGKRHPSIEVAIQLATLAGLEEMPVIAQIEYQTATTEKKKHFWKCYLEQHGIAAALCMTATALVILLTPEPAKASVLHLQNYDAPFLRLEENHNIHYAYFKVRQSGTVRGTVSHFTYLRLAVIPPAAPPRSKVRVRM